MRLLALVLLVGCGPGVDYVGTYEGQLSGSVSCANGDKISPDWTAPAKWSISREAAQLKVVTGSMPGERRCFELTASDTAPARFITSTCTYEMAPTLTRSVSGDFSLTGDKLSVSIIDTLGRTSIQNGDCPMKVTGTLTKQ